jgi:hypothetical protein
MFSIPILNYLFVTGVDGRKASDVYRVGKADKRLINTSTAVHTFPDP